MQTSMTSIPVAAPRAPARAPLPSVDDAFITLEKACVADARLRALVAACRGVPPAEGPSLQPVGVPLATGALILHLVSQRPQGELTLETGFGYGVSASFFALARRPGDDSLHYCFDPFLDWTQGVGSALIKRVGVASSICVVEQPSWSGLPELYRSAGHGCIGVALMDGSQLLDQAMADFVVIDKLLADDGVLLIRDPHLPHAQALISFLRTNAGFDVVVWSDQLAVARRTPGAERPWFQFEPFEVPFFARVHPPGGTVQIRAPDGAAFSFLDEPHHQYYLQRVLQGREYPALHPEIYSPAVILDIGAHVGSAARYFAQRYPAARIVCIEPTPESFELLTENTRHLKNVERHNLAFAERAGVLPIWRGKLTSGQNSAVRNEENGEQSFEAQAVAPLDFCATHGLGKISIVKIDVEGLELQILRNLQPVLRQVDIFYVEYHSEALRRAVEELLGPDYSLFAAEASEADRGTACYARSALIQSLRLATSNARYVFAKQGI
jgi:FkbM family methyltransferase